MDKLYNNWYIGGLFSGDGCVKIVKCKSSRVGMFNMTPELELYTEHENIASLLINTFGGNIYKRKRPIKPDAFEWRIFGHEAVAAGKTLSMVSWTKRDQLLELISFPLGTKKRGGSSNKQQAFSLRAQPKRLRIHDDVKALKKHDCEMLFFITYPEFLAMLAGFLDADGSVPPKGIVFAQKHQNILKEILRRFPGGKLTNTYTTLKGKRYGPYGYLYYSKSSGKNLAEAVLPYVKIHHNRMRLQKVYKL